MAKEKIEVVAKRYADGQCDTTIVTREYTFFFPNCSPEDMIAWQARDFNATSDEDAGVVLFLDDEEYEKLIVELKKYVI